MKIIIKNIFALNLTNQFEHILNTSLPMETKKIGKKSSIIINKILYLLVTFCDLDLLSSLQKAVYLRHYELSIATV